MRLVASIHLKSDKGRRFVYNQLIAAYQKEVNDAKA